LLLPSWIGSTFHPPFRLTGFGTLLRLKYRVFGLFPRRGRPYESSPSFIGPCRNFLFGLLFYWVTLVPPWKELRADSFHSLPQGAPPPRCLLQASNLKPVSSFPLAPPERLKWRPPTSPLLGSAHASRCRPTKTLKPYFSSYGAIRFVPFPPLKIPESFLAAPEGSFTFLFNPHKNPTTQNPKHICGTPRTQVLLPSRTS